MRVREYMHACMRVCFVCVVLVCVGAWVRACVRLQYKILTMWRVPILHTLISTFWNADQLIALYLFKMFNPRYDVLSDLPTHYCIMQRYQKATRESCYRQGISFRLAKIAVAILGLSGGTRLAHILPV